MKLEELLKQITPLPWGVAWNNKTDIEPRNETHPRKASIARTNCSHGLGDAKTQDEANAAYLNHAANILPELVEALKRARDEMYHNGVRPHTGRPIDSDCDCELCNLIRRAENIKLD